MTRDETINPSKIDLTRRAVLKSTAAASAAGILGIPAISGGAVAESTCTDCTSDGTLVKYEWNGDAFVAEGADPNISLIEDSVELDDDGEPQRVCFTTDYCTLSTVVKAGPDTKTEEHIGPQEFVANGGFESPEVSGSWAAFDSVDVPGWTVVRTSNDQSAQLEIQKNVNGWSPAEGDQYAELDGYHPLNISQELDTPDTGDLELSYAWSPRPGVADNELEVSWDGSVVDTHTANGESNNDTDWTVETHTVSAEDGPQTLEFTETGPGDTLGMFLDAVSVTGPGQVCVTGIADENPQGKSVTHAISNVQFYCDAPDGGDGSQGNDNSGNGNGNGGGNNGNGNGNG